MAPASPTELRKQFRAILARDGITSPASVYDAASVRLAKAAGAELALLAGSTASAVVLGAPDLVTLTLTEFAEQCRRVARAGALPLVVDADHGYGNALNAIRTVQELETAGVAALTLEDTLLPAPYGGSEKGAVSHEEYFAKLKAAISARTDPELVISGRTGALTRGESIEETVEWVKLCDAVGVDLIMIQGATTIDQVKAIHAATNLPFILNTQPGTKEELAALGVRILFQGHLSYFNMLRALHETYVEQFTTGSTAGLRKGVLSPELQAIALAETEHDGWMTEFMGGPAAARH